jgi:predicted DNA-binding transcriptional regulator YafY
MDRSERFHLIDQLLQNQRYVSRQRFLDSLEVSLATFKRDLEYLRDRLHAPIVWDREHRAYTYARNERGETPSPLPGLWFSTAEIQALLTMNAWLENLQPGVLSEHVRPLRSRIRALLDRGDHSADELTRRIRILSRARRQAHPDFFPLLIQALLHRKRLCIRHYNRSRNETSERQISPQRLTFYRDNWYLDSWCHQRKAIRSFAVDAIESVELLPDKARDVADARLDRELGSGYGIFSGRDRHWALLRFSPQQARWVSREEWHPEQQGEHEPDGHYRLRIPYSQEPELVMDILRHGAGVEVLEPESLRRRVAQEIAGMAALYADERD